MIMEDIIDMKFVRYELNGKVAYGILADDTIRELEGDPFSDYPETGNEVSLGDVKLLVPTTPSKVLAVGLDYPTRRR